MDEQQARRLDTIFRALADPTRRAILRALTQGEETVGALAAPLPLSFAGASKHIKALERAGLVRCAAQGRYRAYRLDSGPLEEAYEWLSFYERYWKSRLGALETELDEPETEVDEGENDD